MLLQKYSADWVNDFTEIKKQIDWALAGLVYTVEHVGSTAVPGLDAKPIVDIDIIYTTPPDFEKIKTALEQIGYYHNGNQGIVNRDVFKRNGKEGHAILDSIPHHLYVCAAHSEALERHILCRNYLRKHDWARLKYQQLKYELAAKANQDKKVYAALKEKQVNDFIDFMLAEERKSAEN